MLTNISRRPAGRRQQGFTLIEIMVVVVIIGVLAALVAPSILGRTDEARQTAARADINTLMTALKLYRTDNMRYPTSEQGLQALVARPSTEPVPAKWSRPYLDNGKLPRTTGPVAPAVGDRFAPARARYRRHASACRCPRRKQQAT